MNMGSEAIKHFVEVIPERLARGLLWISLFAILGGGWVLAQHADRLRALEIFDVRVSEQRLAEAESLKELAIEIRMYRAEVMGAAAQYRMKEVDVRARSDQNAKDIRTLQDKKK